MHDGFRNCVTWMMFSIDSLSSEVSFSEGGFSMVVCSICVSLVFMSGFDFLMESLSISIGSYVCLS